jgi:hypothetical protein
MYAQWLTENGRVHDTELLAAFTDVFERAEHQ